MKVLIGAVLVVLVGVSCGGPSPTNSPPAPTSLSLLTHDSFAVSDSVLQEFETAHGLTVNVLRSGDAGQMVNQAILTKAAPLADVLYGVDNTFLSRALDAGIFVPYTPAALVNVPQALQLDAQHRVTPIDYADVCINYDLRAIAGGDFGPGKIPTPRTLEDLVEPDYKSMLVVENPTTSSPGLAFLLATIVHFGETGAYTWKDYWRDLRANDVLVSDGWEDAYYSKYSGGSGTGDRPLVVSYATDPAAEVYFATPAPSGQGPSGTAEFPASPVGVMTDGCFRQVEFAGVLAGTAKQAQAQAFIDFLLSPTFQADIPLQMFVYPARQGVSLPLVFDINAVKVPDPLTMDPQTIEANRDRWLQEWADVVLH